MKIAKLKVLKPFGSYKTDEIIKIEVDENNTPLNGFWRRRLKDSERDKCVKLIAEDKSTKRAPKKSK